MDEIIVKVNNSGINKKIIYIGIVVIIVIAIGAGLYFFDLIPSGILKKVTPEKPQIIEENLVIPNTQNITGSEARTITNGNLEVPLVPKSEGEKVIVSKAVLTVKGSIDTARAEAQNWSSDAKLVFVKSLGAVTLEGKSSQWQVTFSAATQKGKGYEVIIQGDQIVSKKEIESTATGADVPADLMDSGRTIVLLQELPQFSDATVSSINLYFNTDGKVWRYALSTSRGIAAMSATQ